MSLDCSKIKVGILAGGLGSRLAEETETKPKPMVEIGGLPILWHIMKIYANYGVADFSVALGYKGEYIKRWFNEHFRLSGSVSVQTRSGQVFQHFLDKTPDWNVNLIETGKNSGTGGRIRKLAPWLGGKTMMVTYGDGVSDIDIRRLLAFHKSHGRLATLAAVRPPARYGRLEFDGDQITQFSEKPQIGEGWINGGFFVLEPEAIEYISGDEEMFEVGPLSRLAQDGQLMAYRHDAFWQCMDTMREKALLEEYWRAGNAPWKVWKDEAEESAFDWAAWLNRDQAGRKIARSRA